MTTDDTPRDPLAALRHAEAVIRTLERQLADTQHNLEVALSKPPSGDEALRSRVAALVSPMTAARSLGSEPYPKGYVSAINDVLAILATPSSTPDNLE